jgi:hypothetical protein
MAVSFAFRLAQLEQVQSYFVAGCGEFAAACRVINRGRVFRSPKRIKEM